ncbi:hypothetical protein BDB00DRAFT_770812, partial [Zychaea mexicana]|uniref:uncharacterized protein n=1 Tax=Zychaea mexicana TaxID=64656 RepID=UPI0022FE757E
YLSYTKNVCLVVVDYAGLSTNVPDLYDFIRKHQNLQKIIVDHLPYENDVKVFDREELLDIKSLEVFNCRKGNYHRSK